MGARCRARDPRPAEDADEDVLPLRERLRRGREHTGVPGLPRLSRGTPGPEQDRARVDDQARARARLRDPAPGGLLAQELLLPRPAEGLSDLPIRSTFLHQRRSASANRGRRPRDRNRACAPRGGRGEDDARRRPHGQDRRRRLLPRRLQPRGDAPRRDRHRPGHPFRRGRAPLPAAAPADRRRARHLRRRDGEGNAACRRQRLRAAGGVAGAAHALRAEEHELVPVRCAGDRRRGRTAGRALRGRRRGAAGHLRLRCRDGDADRAPLEGGGRRLPLLPRARSRPGRAAARARRAPAGRGA